MDKNIKTVRVDSEDDLFKILNSLGILGGRPFPKMSAPVCADEDKNKSATLTKDHACSYGGKCKNENKPSLEDLSKSIYDNKKIALNFVSNFGLEAGDRKTTFPMLNQYNISDFVAAVNANEEDSVYIGLDNGKFLAIPFDNLTNFIEWLQSIYMIVSSETNYFAPAVEMTRQEIEKALGHKFILCD